VISLLKRAVRFTSPLWGGELIQRPSFSILRSGFNRSLNPLITVAFVLVCWDCSTAASSSNVVFERPQAYLGKQVRVCGYVHFALEDTNIWPDERTQKMRGDGLGILYFGHDAAVFRLNGMVKCISGKIIRTGCKTDKDKICNWSDNDYAIQLPK